MKSFSRGLMLALSVCLMGSVSFGNESKDIDELNERLKAYESGAEPQWIFDKSWQKVARQLAEDDLDLESKCSDARLIPLTTKFTVSFDSKGQPCRIYDLSFATLGSLFSSPSVAKIPVQSFEARDYLNWMDGNYSQVLGKISSFKADFSQVPKTQLARWVKRIEFQDSRLLAVTPKVQETGLPRKFLASDIELGRSFSFSPRQKRQLQDAIAVADQLAPAGMSALSAAQKRAWLEAVENPRALLSKMSFEWNDAEKVYDLIVAGDFLPLSAPLALVDYQASYKVAVERILRSVVHSALKQLVRFVPSGSRQIVGIALDEAFESLDMAYEYQLNQLESALRAAQLGRLKTDLDSQTIDRGLNILFGGRADVVTEYIMASAQGRPFGWDQFESIGTRVRYQTEKARDIMMTNLYSRMVLDRECSMALIYNYFGVCKTETSKTTHSMISENHVLFWNLGAPMIYREDRPSQVLLMRSGAYLLSFGARMLNLPIVSYFSGMLADALKGYARAGITDEGFLMAELSRLKEASGRLDPSEAKLHDYLYLQNLNPFLAKSEGREARVIEANSNILARKLETSETELTTVTTKLL